MTTDTLTALGCVGDHSAGKRHRWADGQWETLGYDAGRLFRVATTEVSDIFTLSQALIKVERCPRWYVVRGEQVDPRVKYVRRTYLGDSPGFRPADRRWLCLDIDGLKHDGRDALTQALEVLPDYLQGVSCHWQLSSSYGIKTPREVSVHLWFWLDRPACDFSLRAWAKTIPYVDPALYNPVQPHYTALPDFVGAPDPVEVRGGLRIGASSVAILPPEVVDLATYKAQREKAEREEQARREAASRRAQINLRSDNQREHYALKALESACRTIREAAPGGRHHAIISESAAMGSLAEYLPANIAIRELEQAAIDVLPANRRASEAGRTVRDGWNLGLQEPRDLSHVGAIDAEITEYADDDPYWRWGGETCDLYEPGPGGACKHLLGGELCRLPTLFLCDDCRAPSWAAPDQAEV